MRYILFLIFLLPAGYAGAEDTTLDGLPRERTVIRGDGTPGPYPIGIRFIGGSAMVDTAGKTPPYPAITASDDGTGTVTFDRPVAPGDSVAVSAAPVPPWLPETYRRPPGETTETAGPSGGYAAAIARTPNTFPGLSFGGSKTFDVSVGSGREAALTQSLNLNIAGNLTNDIILNGVISDQNIPISPEGNTADLEELDRVLIKLRGNHFSADMGDTDLRRTGGRWLSWSRRLSGASLGVRTGGFTVSGSGAVSEGRFMSVTITPTEGSQGPYRLSAADGSTDITVIAGTERIWINGVRLSRGESADYTIDYSTGEVTFTARRIIGADMRIVADYEYTSESYRRTFSSGAADGSLLGGRVKIGIAAAREADDVSRPVLLDLDDDARAALAASGDSAAVVSGIRSASGDSAGYYDLVDGHLVYNAAGTGAYNAAFSWAGQDSGSYRYTGAGIYVFVPEEERISGSGASYEPMETIAAPVSHAIAGVQISAEPWPWLKLDAEAAGSSYDGNTLSGRGDSDNDGGAWRGGIGLSPVIRAGTALRLDLTANRSNRGETFRPLDRDRSAEENRRWNIPLTLDTGREEITEFSGGLSLAEGRFAGTGFSVNGGTASFDDSAISERTGITGALLAGNRGALRVEASRISRSGISGLADEDADRLTGSARLVLRGFVPSLSYEYERDERADADSSGAGWNDVRVGMQSPESGFARGTVEWYFRNELAKHIVWEDSARVRGGSAALTLGRGVTGSLRTAYSQRERTTEDARNTTRQAEIEGSYHPAGSGVSVDASYSAGRLREASKSLSYIYIGAGLGQYRWEDANGDGVRDLDEFIPDEYGSYYRYEETLDDYRPVNTVHAYTRLALDFPLPGNATKGRIRSETTFEVNEKSTAPASDVFFLKLRTFRHTGVTTSGDSRIQQDMTAPFRGGSLRLRLFRLDSFSGEYVSGEEQTSEEEESLRLRLPMRERTDVEVTLARGGKSRSLESGSSGDFAVRTYSLDAGCTLYAYGRSSFGGDLAAGRDRDSVSGIRSLWWLLEPRYAYRISEKGRTEAAYTLTTVRLDGDTGATLPYTMARGNNEGANHAISASYDHRATANMNITATYSGRKFAGEKFENYGQVQMRAIF